MSHKTVLRLIVAMLLPIHSLLAHEILGTVKDKNSGEILAGVNVSLKHTNYGAATTQEGDFTIKNVPAGEYIVVVSMIGYETIEKKINCAPGQKTRFAFELISTPYFMQEIVVEREMLIGNPNRLHDIPGSAHYLGPRELEKFGYNDIHRVLREIPGVNLQEEDGYGLRPNIGIRGSGSERSEKISIMEDGVLIAPAPYSAPAAYYFPTAGRMEGVEVRKGSSQIKYGPYTTAGALNLISTTIPAALSGRAMLSGGEDNARTIHANVGDSKRNYGFLAETYLSSVDGFKTLDSGGKTGFDKKDYMLKFRVNTDRNAKVYQELALKLGQTDEISNETYLGLTDADFLTNPLRRYAGSQQDLMTTKHSQAVARYFIKPTKSFDLTAIIYRNDFKRNWYKLDKVYQGGDEGGKAGISSILASPDNYAPHLGVIQGAPQFEDNRLDVKANNRSYYSQGVQLLAGLNYDLGASKNELEFGARYHEDEIDRFQWVDGYRMENSIMKLIDAGVPGTESNRIGQAQVLAVFLQQNMRFSNLTIVPGVRWEDIKLTRDDYGKNDPERIGADLSQRENSVSVFIPGVGLDYKFSPFFSAFGGVHKGFSPPGSSPNTNPEESVNYEIGFRISKRASYLQTTLFFNNYSNLLGSDLAAGGGTGSGDQFNGGEVNVSGLEFLATHDLAEAFASNRFSIPFRLSYSYTKAEFQNAFESDFGPWGSVEKGFELPYVPQHQFFAGIGLEGRRWTIDLRGNFVDKMRTQAGTGNLPKNQSTDARLIFDLNAEFDVNSSNKAFVGVRNLTNKTYIVARRPAGVRPGLPRTLHAGIKATF